MLLAVKLKIILLIVKSNKCRKDIKQIGKNKIFWIWRKKVFFNNYKSNFVRDSNFDESSSNKKEKEVKNDKGYKERHKKKNIYKPELSIFYSRSGDYLNAMWETDSFSIKKI